ncbi:MAG: hypothetical protein O7C59_07165, partial [Rickettsia endosymbiont of Ixodes persulcatus]|nr:hypothetical protein [Rickettsia endosymbiont of Ixodes persulcatus]
MDGLGGEEEGEDLGFVFGVGVGVCRGGVCGGGGEEVDVGGGDSGEDFEGEEGLGVAWGRHWLRSLLGRCLFIVR